MVSRKLFKQMKKYTEQELVDFETKVAEIFNSGVIKSPVHLYDGNESQIINVFDNVSDDDWIFCTWRSHYQCLLKGVPPETLIDDIKSGKSITLCYPEFNIYSSAIVTGSIPISVGVAMDIKRKKQNNHVWCFVGDMASETGAFFENYKYSLNHDLPITFVVEDNNKSVCTDTRKTWNTENLTFNKNSDKIIYYSYQSRYPHAGAGKRIQF
jgi:TPP-dependent pyruvate/acetoin dehydrogenase alpha subunit